MNRPYRPLLCAEDSYLGLERAFGPKKYKISKSLNLKITLHERKRVFRQEKPSIGKIERKNECAF